MGRCPYKLGLHLEPLRAGYACFHDDLLPGLNVKWTTGTTHNAVFHIQWEVSLENGAHMREI